MSYAPSSTYFSTGDESIIGMFFEKECGNLFEYSHNNTHCFTEYPHLVWVTEPTKGIDQGFRYAVVKKTVIHIVVDEDENGFVVEKWNIKGHKMYTKS